MTSRLVQVAHQRVPGPVRVVEVVLVLSIDGAFYPFQWYDMFSAAIIFGLMFLIAALSLSDPSKGNLDKDDGARH
jgi:hypothetical protein